MTYWTWASAACRGTSHEKSGTPVEDSQSAFVCRTPDNAYFVGIVSDGAGSAKFGRYGSVLVCRTLSAEIRNHFRSNATLPSRDQVECWVDSVRDRIFSVSERRAATPRDFAATMICVLATNKSAAILHIGDGCAALRVDPGQNWIAPIWPDHGEYASTTSFVVDSPSPNLRFEIFEGEISGIALLSDGLERLALDFSNRTPFSRFFNGVTLPLTHSTTKGKDPALSNKLKEFLGGESVNSRTDDDKTLIIAIPR
jgi:hypothetical protein